MTRWLLVLLTAGCAASAAPSGLLQAAPHGDGDSWKDTAGKEYRMGLVNAPELNECFGAEASRVRKSQVADGFRATTYSTDRYGRLVSVITTADGVDLNVWMAERGYVTDTYLAQFRDENPSEARRLDAAFAEAKRMRRGLWAACR